MFRKDGLFGRKNLGLLAFLASVTKQGRTSRRLLEMQLAFNKRRRVLNLVCVPIYYSFLKEHHSSTVTELVQFLPDVCFFLKSIYFVNFSKKTTRGTPPNCLFSNSLLSSSSSAEHGIQTGIMHIKQVFVLSIGSKRNTFLLALPAILFRTCKTLG